MDKLIRSLIVLSVLAVSAKALDMEEAIALYKTKGREMAVLSEGLESYKNSYNNYQISRGFGMPLTNVTNYNYYKAETYSVTNTSVVGIKLMDLNISSKFDLGYDLTTSQYATTSAGARSIGASFNLTDVLYYSSGAHTVDDARITYEKAIASTSQAERFKIGTLIDLYVGIKTLEGKLDIKKRSLSQLQQDREYMATKYSIGTIAKVDVERVELEMKTSQQEADTLQKQIFSYKLNLCDKLSVLPDPYIELDKIDHISLDQVLVDDTNLYLLEKTVEEKEAAIKAHRRSVFPNIAVGGGYNNVDKKYYVDASVSWDLFSFASGSKALNEGQTVVAKQNLAIAKAAFGVTKEAEKIEYENAESALQIAEESSLYWERLANVKRDMYKSDLISFQEYMRYYNEAKDKQIAAETQKNSFNGLKRKIKLLEK